MPGKFSYDAVIVGSGPNGLAAAIRLAQQKLSVLVLEANSSIGGGTRSAELTLPGFIHDICSAVHPLALGSPFFRQLPLEHYGLRWINGTKPELSATASAGRAVPCAPNADGKLGSARTPPAEQTGSGKLAELGAKGIVPLEFALAHPLDGGRAATLQRSVQQTAAGLGEDQRAYQRLMDPLVSSWEPLAGEFLQPLLHWPRHPWLLGRFGLRALRSAAGLATKRFAADPARALFAGLAAHSFLRLEQPGSAAFGLVLGMLGHAIGWPLPRGGSQQIANALAAHLRSLGGEITLDSRIEHWEQLPPARATLLDLTPRQFLKLAADQLPPSYRQRLELYRYGPGVFKLDYALNAPIPWTAAACGRAGTVHLGGTLEEIAAAERAVADRQLPERPFVLLVQPTRFDPARAPAGKHIAWAYCHVPNGSRIDMTERIERQIERFAPGFRDCVLARHASDCAHLEASNPNLVGGDINGGAADLWQLLARPVLSPTPYRTPLPGVYLCSAATPPGGGVHGMCGFHAAEAALHDVFQ